MAKNIVLSSDGTGNQGPKKRGTNVWRLYNAVERDSSAPRQITFYDDGVGTGKYRLLKIMGGAFGWGFGRNVKDLYKFLVKNYEPGDDIYLFGFSRGAFTVRAFAGFLNTCGLLKNDVWASEAELDRRIKKAFRVYKRRKKAPRKAEMFKQKYGVSVAGPDETPVYDIKIKFIGVWDTVSALGLPFDISLQNVINYFFRFKFYDHELNANVERGCHALSLDDERKTFHPEMWKARGEEIEQVWFAGVHSNVGGGYPRAGLSNVALDWMMKRAHQGGQGLRFHQPAWDQIRHRANVHGKLYDSRAGPGAYYRYEPRDIRNLCADHGIQSVEVHASVLDRIERATDGYNPGTIPHDYPVEIVTTRPPLAAQQQQITAWNQRLQTYRANAGPILQRANRWVLARQCLHFTFVLVSLAAVAMVGWFGFISPPETPADPGRFAEMLRNVAEWFLPAFLEQPVGALILQCPWCAVALIVVLVIMFFLRRYLRRKTAAIYEQACRYLRP